jgi:hypothetical protein
VWIDHCSVSWSTDENISASGPRFEGETPDEWRRNTSHRITISRCIIAEGLRDSTHRKGAHSKGSLIHDNAAEIAIVENLYAANVDRNPLFKGGARGIVANNLIVNPAGRAVHYGLVASEWGERPREAGWMAVVGNVLRRGADSRRDLPVFSFRGDGPLKLHAGDNLVFDRSGEEVDVPPWGGKGPLPEAFEVLEEPAAWPEGYQVRPAAWVVRFLPRKVGARPWARDPIDERIVRQCEAGNIRIIDHEDEVGGYPVQEPVHRPFDPAEWDLDAL